MIDLHLIGIASGDPAHLTIAARDALAEAEVVLVPFKGAEKGELSALRHHLIAQFCGDRTRVVTFDMPVRDPGLAYLDAVEAWHDAIADRWSAALNTVPAARRAALLVWGDPSLYDSTLRIATRLDPAPRVTVVPGLTALQLLTAAHALPLNTLGGEVLITTGRQLKAQGWPERVETLAVMLDGGCAFQSLDAKGLDIWWGAYLGMAQQVLCSGPLADAASEIVQTRAALKAQHGWIMDTYLLRRRATGEDSSVSPQT